MQRLERRVLEWCQQQSLLSAADRVLVALSGGPDSVALLRVLMAFRPTLGLRLAAAHLNHSLRGAESDADQAFVEALCQQLEIPLQCRRLPPGSLAGPGNLEARLRHHRYAFLLEEAQRLRAVLATGHTLDDQAETFLLRAARGAGARGLSSIPPCRRKKIEKESSAPFSELQPKETSSAPASELADKILRPLPAVEIVRPLLNSTRAEVLEYLELIGQPFRLDSSNRDAGRDRNWVRLSLIPLLESRLNPQIRKALGRTAQVLREIDRDLRRRARRFLKRHGRVDRHGNLLIAIHPLESVSAALRRQIVQEALRRTRGHRRGVELSHIDAALDLLRKPSGRSLSLPTCRVRREFDQLSFSRGADPENFSYEVRIPGQVFVKQLGRTVSVHPSDDVEPAPDALFSLAARDRIIVRNRRPGDRIRIGGRRRKLKTVLLELRMPLRQRERLLVIEQDGVVAAVEGVGVADEFQTPKPGAAPVQIRSTATED